MAARTPLGSSVRGFQTVRPSLPALAIDRPRVWARLDEIVDAHRVTVVVASTGFAKTATLCGWAARSLRPVAWLSLTAADRHPGHLRRKLAGVVDMLGVAPLARENLDESGASDWPVFVIDDVHLADSAPAREVLATLLERDELRMRIVLSGRHEPKLRLSKLEARGELGRLTSEELAFTVGEVERAAAALGRQLTAEHCLQLHEATGGWPVAVRLALMSEPDRTGAPLLPNSREPLPQLVDYLVENMLDDLPENLAQFVPLACTCDRLTGDLAAELSGDDRAAELLEQAVTLGLPLERRSLPDGQLLYSWHPVMAQTGRALLLRRDPALARELHRRAARWLAVEDPYEAARHALNGRDPELAASVIRSQWLAGVLRGDSELVDELCGQLPVPLCEDAEILAVRATCRRNVGDADGAARLAKRGALAASGLDADRRAKFDTTRMLADLFLADEEDDIIAACQRVQGFLDRQLGLDGALQACAVFLLGWALFRVRRVSSALPLLEEAAQRCRAAGLDDLADRAGAYLTYALAFSGDFPGALAAIRSAPEAGVVPNWRRVDGAVEAYSLGWVRFWSGDFEDALDAFRRAAEQGGSTVTSFASLARLWWLHSAVAQGAPGAIAEAEVGVASLPDATIQGLPWASYKLIAQAEIEFVHGNPDRAARLVDTMVGLDKYTPAISVLAAELYWRVGRPASARAQAAAILLGNPPDYLRIACLVVIALCDRLDRFTEPSHVGMEEALALASTLGLTRSFRLRDDALAQLLAEHAQRGTRFETFLARMIAEQGQVPESLPGDLALSGREREVLSHLATSMSAAEICQALFISQNTLKTHLRSIYRKLGVGNRRDAVRLIHRQLVR